MFSKMYTLILIVCNMSMTLSFYLTSYDISYNGYFRSYIALSQIITILW